MLSQIWMSLVFDPGYFVPAAADAEPVGFLGRLPVGPVTNWTAHYKASSC
jgi:hypothetical protein